MIRENGAIAVIEVELRITERHNRRGRRGELTP